HGGGGHFGGFGGHGGGFGGHRGGISFGARGGGMDFRAAHICGGGGGPGPIRRGRHGGPPISGPFGGGSASPRAGRPRSPGRGGAAGAPPRRPMGARRHAWATPVVGCLATAPSPTWRCNRTSRRHDSRAGSLVRPGLGGAAGSYSAG